MVVTRKKDTTLPRFSFLGDCALLCEAPPPLNIAWQRKIWALAAQAEGWPGVQEAVPGMNNLMLVFDPLTVAVESLRDNLLKLWPHCDWDGGACKTHEVPAVYGGEAGRDLEHVARHAGLSTDEVVRLHVEPVYTVYCLGAYPGFGYLGGLHPKLAAPRRREPRLQIPLNSIGIGGAQTAVITSTLSSGWQLIGIAGLVFFDLTKEQPALLAPGDSIRFRVDRIER